MYKKILCAVEVNKEGKEVLKKALVMARVFDAELFVIHTMPYQLLPKDYQKELKEKVLPDLEAMTSSLGIAKSKVSVKFGKPYEQICEMADKKQVNLILLGTHSKKGIQALIGSTANGVVNYAKCDVSLIKI